MAIADIDAAMTGIGTNPAMIIRAPDFVSQGVSVVSDPDYFEGKAVRGLFPGQQLFETGWLKKGVLTGNMVPLCFISDGNSGTPLVNAYDRIKIVVYRRVDKDTDPSQYRITPMVFLFTQDHSNASGSSATDVVTNISGNRYFYFNKSYEYKLVAYVDRITTGGYMDVEAMKFQTIVSSSWHSGYQGAATVTTDEGPESIDVIDTWVWTATADSGTGSTNTGRLQCRLPISEFQYDGSTASYGRSITYGTGFTGYYSDYGFRSKFADIEGAVTEMWGGTTTSNMQWLTSKSALSEKNCYTVEFYGIGFVNSGQVYMSTTVFGAQFPIEV